MKLAHALAEEIKKQSPTTVVKLFNISKCNKNDIMTQVFKSKAIAVGSPTVSKSILSSVSGWLHFLQELSLKGKKAAVFGCYGWSGEGNKILREELTKAGFEVIDEESILTLELLKLGRFMEKRYFTSLMSCYQTMLPKPFKLGTQEKLQDKKIT